MSHEELDPLDYAEDFAKDVIIPGHSVWSQWKHMQSVADMYTDETAIDIDLVNGKIIPGFDYIFSRIKEAIGLALTTFFVGAGVQVPLTVLSWVHNQIGFIDPLLSNVLTADKAHNWVLHDSIKLHSSKAKEWILPGVLFKYYSTVCEQWLPDELFVFSLYSTHSGNGYGAGDWGL